MPGHSDSTVEALASDVDEFLGYIAIVKTPEMDAVRGSLERALGSAKRELLPLAHRSDVAGPAAFVRRHPYVAAGAAAALGALLGTLAFSRQ